MSLTGNIFKFESFATKDGDGIRGAVFLVGCPLRCAYCHNPDGWQGGQSITAEELTRKFARFKTYYRNGGGATISGGEPLCQGAFVAELAARLKEEGISVALDTSGSVYDEYTPSVVRAVDHIILDLKFSTREEYERYTGGNPDTVKKFLALCEGKRLWLRTVVVPGLNDTERAMDGYAEFAKDIRAEKYELLPFHTMGFSKYEALGIENPLRDVPAMDRVRVAQLQRYLDGALAAKRRRGDAMSAK